MNGEADFCRLRRAAVNALNFLHHRFYANCLAYCTNFFAAGESVLLSGRRMPMVMLRGGSNGSFTTSACQFSVMRLFVIVMPRPFSIIAMAAKDSMVE